VAVSGKRILVVDDDLSIAEGVSAILEIHGYAAAHVQTSSSAFASIAARPPDAIILDLILSEEDGLSLYRELAARWPDLPIILATGQLDLSRLPPESERLRILSKQVDSETLVAVLREMGI